MAERMIGYQNFLEMSGVVELNLKMEAGSLNSYDWKRSGGTKKNSDRMEDYLKDKLNIRPRVLELSAKIQLIGNYKRQDKPDIIIVITFSMAHSLSNFLESQ